MQAIALIILIAAGLWLAGVAVLMALRPRYCLHLFEKMSANLAACRVLRRHHDRPIRWHGAYGTWWVKRLKPWVIRALSPVPAVLGAGMIYAAV